MGLAIARSRALRGLEAHEIRVETHLANGLPTFTIVGLPEATVRESRDRVRAAIVESGFEFPSRRITVNLAPAELPKDGSRLDLPIAVGILCAAGHVPASVLDQVELAGELSLTGTLRAVTGGLALACGLVVDGSPRSLILPNANAAEARLSGLGRIFGADSLAEVCDLLRRFASGTAPEAEAGGDAGSAAASAADPSATGAGDDTTAEPDLDDVIGQPVAKRALEISAAGDHHLLLCGPPGTGKSMLAERLRGLRPPLTARQALEHAMIASLRRQRVQRLDRRPAFRGPHHSTSAAGLIGGGQPPSPGEISLAHHGILFLDELPEFRRQAIEALREPLETGRITVSRGRFQATFPAAFVLVAAMNPCPCGYLGDGRHDCVCTADQVRRYRTRLSGPFLDRFDLRVDVKRPDPHEIARAAAEGASRPSRSTRRASGSALARIRIAAARDRQLRRQGCPNGRLPSAGELEARLGLTAAASRIAHDAMSHFGWSMRGLHRTLKVARTIADLDAVGNEATGPDDRGPDVDSAAVAEAIALRQPSTGRT